MWLSARSAAHSSQSAYRPGQGVGDLDELVAHEDLRPPGRHPGPALHQGHERLATVEGLVDGRQVPDLKRDWRWPPWRPRARRRRRCPCVLVCTRPTENNDAPASLTPTGNESGPGPLHEAVAEDVQPEEGRELAINETGPTAARRPSLRAKLRTGRATSMKQRFGRPGRPTGQELQPRAPAGQHKGR